MRKKGEKRCGGCFLLLTSLHDLADSDWQPRPTNGPVEIWWRSCCSCREAAAGGDATAEDRAFDVLTRELVFEAKAKPGQRTLAGVLAGGMGCAVLCCAVLCCAVL